MCPVDTMFDSKNWGLANPKFSGNTTQAPASGEEFTDFYNIFVCQFGAPDFCAMPSFVPISPFGHHVLDIVVGCPEKEMFRVTARRVITVVEDMKPIWDCAAEEFPGDAVHHELFIHPLPLAITGVVGATSPLPANSSSIVPVEVV